MDHERVNCSTTPISCGVMELSRYDSDVEAVCYSVGARLYHPARGEPVAYLIWSDIVEGTGHILSRFIEDKQLGIVTRAIPKENPKTGNIITVWTCCIDHLVWKNWYALKRQEKFQKVGS